MASYYVPLPRYDPGPQGIDFSPLSRGFEAVGQKLEKNRLLQQSKDIGAALTEGGYGGAADKAFALGDLNTGLSLAQAEGSQEDREFNRNRLLASDRRAAAAEGRSSELHGLNVQKAQEDLRTNLINRTAGIAQTIRNETDPQRKSALVQAFVNAHPKLKTQLDAYNFDPANPDPTLDMIIAEAQGLSGAGATYGTTPQYYTDAEGNLRVGQMSNKGGFRPVDIPGTIQPTVQFQDTGTAIVPLSRQTGQPAAPAIPKDVAGEAAAKEVGKAQGEAVAASPAIVQRGTQMINAIDALLGDEYLPSMTGPVEGRQPNISGSASRVQSRMDQLQGQLFLQAYQDLKGGGAISDFEAGKAEQALGRIGNPTLSDDDYRAALTELRAVINAGVQRAQSGATGQAGQQPTTRLRYNPETGELE